MAAQPQDVSGARILLRQARVSRGGPGHYRVIEVLLVELANEIAVDHVLSEPLPLIVLPERVGTVMGMGGDVSPSQVVHDPPGISVVGSVGTRTFEVAFTYTVPSDESSTAFAARLPVDEFVLEIDRATVDARPDPLMEAADPGGTDSRPLSRYQAMSLAAGETLTLRMADERVSWRQRIAVLIAGALAAAAAGLAVWRRRGLVGLLQA